MASGKKNSGMVLILLALVILGGLGAAYILIIKPSQQKAAEPLPTPTMDITSVEMIYVTTQNIQRGETISEDKIAKIAYPKKDFIPNLFIIDPTEVVGKRAKYALDAGVPVTPNMLLDAGGGSIASMDVPPGYTAVSIPITRLTSVSYALQSGDHIMVIGCMSLVDLDPDFQTKLPNNTASVEVKGTLEGVTNAAAGIISGNGPQGRAELDPTLNLPIYVVGSEDQRSRIVCQNVIADAAVLKIGNFLVDGVYKGPGTESEPAPTPVPAAEGESAATPEPPAPPDVITLIVSPQDAILINYLMVSDVKLNLALRNPTDSQPVLTEAVTLQYLMDQKGIPLPAKLPYGLEPRVDKLKFPYMAGDPQLPIE